MADVVTQSDNNDDNPPQFGKDKIKYNQGLHHVLDEVAHSRPASWCIQNLGPYITGSIYFLACIE